MTNPDITPRSEAISLIHSEAHLCFEAVKKTRDEIRWLEGELFEQEREWRQANAASHKVEEETLSNEALGEWLDSLNVPHGEVVDDVVCEHGFAFNCNACNPDY